MMPHWAADEEEEEEERREQADSMKLSMESVWFSSAANRESMSCLRKQSVPLVSMAAGLTDCTRTRVLSWLWRRLSHARERTDRTRQWEAR